MIDLDAFEDDLLNADGDRDKIGLAIILAAQTADPQELDSIRAALNLFLKTGLETEWMFFAIQIVADEIKDRISADRK